jgi:cytochrome P450/NADPH-cytochrome P450 reductase
VPQGRRAFRAGPTVYVCGDGRRMAPGVHETCVRIYCEVTGANETDGLAWLDVMQREHSRYVPDVFV